jgi:hypothetical protein
MSTSYDSGVNTFPISPVINRLGVLVTADAKDFIMAIGARFPLCQRPYTMPPHFPETRVILRAV